MNKGLLIAALLFVFSCSDNKDGDSGTSNTPENSSIEKTSPAKDGPAVASLETDDYTAKIHRAIPFVAKQDDMGLYKVKDGYQYIVLDMSIKNTSDQIIEMGQILLETKVKDEKGNNLDLSITAIAAYTYTNPVPGHQAQYDAMWGAMKPGDFYRTTAFGIEAPKDSKTFILSMPLKEGFGSDIPRKEVQFSL